jgi:hypothetical protein
VRIPSGALRPEKYLRPLSVAEVLVMVQIQ